MHCLVGQYDSPFLRRVAVTMHYYGIPYERKVLSVFRNADEVAEINPLMVREDGAGVVAVDALLRLKSS